MKKEEINIKLKECFKKCALGRQQLRKCVINSMKLGLTKEDVLAVSYELGKKIDRHEVSLCAITAIGQVFGYEERYKAVKPRRLSKREIEDIKDKLKGCFKKCDLARRQLRKCIINAINAGLSKEEIFSLTDEIVGGLGKNEVSACAMAAVNEVLKLETSKKKKPANIVKKQGFGIVECPRCGVRMRRLINPQGYWCPNCNKIIKDKYMDKKF